MACPFIDMGYRECRKHMTLNNIRKAVEHCANNYTECRIYHQLFQKKLMGSRKPVKRIGRKTA